MLRLRIVDTSEGWVTSVLVFVVGTAIAAPLLTVVIVNTVPALQDRIALVLGGLFAAGIVGAIIAGLLARRAFVLTVDGPLVQVFRRKRAVFRCCLDRAFGARLDLPTEDAGEETPYRIVLEQDGARFYFAGQRDPTVWQGLPFVVRVDPEEEVLGVAEPTLVEGDVEALVERIVKAGGQLCFLPLWPWEQALHKLWTEYQPGVVLGKMAFGHVRLLVREGDDFFLVTDEEVVTPWFRLPREETIARPREYLARRGLKHRIDLLHGGERYRVATSRWMTWDEARAVAHFINGERPPQLGGTAPKQAGGEERRGEG